ncbi:MAG TPA: YjbE family putative metal transport protein, partial [Ktedonobacterales bacterium]
MIANWFASGGAQWLLTVAGIILVDIALSGDNALVIGAAASRLVGRRRTFALIWGGLAAAIIRIVLTGVATELLLIPLVQSVGAVVILFIAVRMLLPERDDDGAGRRASERLWTAILSILVADVTMSLDNVLAVGALARGDLPLLVIGLAISVALLLLA